MGSPGVYTSHRTPPKPHLAQAGLWLAAIAAAAAGGAAATRIPTTYVIGFVALAAVLVVFLWRSQDPIVPFLLLVAALQGGILLQISMGDAPVYTLMPFLGGWTLLAVLLDRRRSATATPASPRGRRLVPSLASMAVVIVLTAVAQIWRPGGRTLTVDEILTLAQLAILVVLAAYLLAIPRRVLMVAYVTIASGVLVALVALAEQAGLFTLGTAVIQGDGYTRVSGLLEDPNYFSFQLLIALAFAVHVAVAARTPLWRVLFWMAAGLITAGIVSTYSAGALVGLGALVVTTLVLQFRVSTKRAAAVFVAMAIVAGVVALTAPAEYGQAVKEKFSSITTSSFEQIGTKRGAAWEASVDEFVHNPVLGTGLSTESEQIAIAEYYHLYTTDRKAAHNMYLAIAVTTGVFGLAAFLVILGSCFSILWTTHSRAAQAGDDEATLAAAGLLTALVVIMTQGLQLDTQMTKYTWLVIGACLGVRRWAAGRRPALGHGEV